MRRECSSCTLCCKVLGVIAAEDETHPILPKAAGKWCSECTPGSGCRIYETRPVNCKDWDCGWIVNNGYAIWFDKPDDMRPDNLHMIVSGESTILEAYVIHVDPAYPDAPDRPKGKALLRALITWGKYKNIVLVMNATKRRYIGDERKIAAALERAQKMYDRGEIKKLL